MISIALMTADHRTRWLEPARAGLATLTTPVYVVGELPYAFFERVASWAKLAEDNAELRQRVLALSVEAQRVRGLQEENARLRRLLGSTGRVPGPMLFAEVVGVGPDPLRHVLVLGKGAADGVREGQAVLDATGLMGQVVEVAADSARVLLVTDLSHATPVQVERNDLRAVLHGSGDPGGLTLRDVPDTGDVRSGDLLITSGLGGRFPPRYPVAVVETVEHDPAEPFAIIRARPTAQLQRSRHLVLVGRERSVAAEVDRSEPPGDGDPVPDVGVAPSASAEATP